MIQGQPSGNPNNGDLQPSARSASPATCRQRPASTSTAATTPRSPPLTLAGATTSELHTINLATGAATRVNAIGGGERVRGLTLTASPQATLLGVTTDNRLISFKTATPGTLDSNVAITGLARRRERSSVSTCVRRTVGSTR